VKRVKRQAALTAALETFLEHGYAGTSLQRIAGRARVSTATLYKSFPTKAALFEAIVPELWALTAARNTPVAIGDPRSGLRTIGREIAAVCRQPNDARILPRVHRGVRWRNRPMAIVFSA
jgi:AcrR family transcriptional regulator